jgi:hypothetical protein
MTLRNRHSSFRFRKFGYIGLLVTFLLVAAIALARPADDRKVETIDATAMGTSTQLGKNVSVKVTIYEFSTPEDRQILVVRLKRDRIKDWSMR